MNSGQTMYWADLHNHNEIGYGQGTLERSYRIAENCLDVYALTVHGHWPDPPASDAALVGYHQEALGKIGAAFPEVERQANLRYRPGRFVTFIGYEWHSTTWGDYVVLFPGERGELYCANTLHDLQQFVRRLRAVMIPHHVGYKLGARGLDWGAVDFALSPLVEIFSEHGSSWDRDDPWPMLAHSMGGVTTSQTVRDQLEAGRHFGFTAGTDTHFGYPGTYGEGLTGILARELTRESVFEALRHRRTIAVTGDRISLWADSGGAVPGDILPSTAPRRFAVQVDPLSPMDYVEVLKNGIRRQLWPAHSASASQRPGRGRHMVRIEWGWGRLGAADEADWKIRLTLEGGCIRRVVPCFAGGAGSIEKASEYRHASDTTVEIDSFSSRRNSLPVSGVVLEIDAVPSTRLRCHAEVTVEGERGGCELGASMNELGADDVWAAALPRFSAPRIRLGRAWVKSDLQMAVDFEDPQPGRRDTYVFRARQTNGQTAWASPFLFTDVQ